MDDIIAFCSRYTSFKAADIAPYASQMASVCGSDRLSVACTQHNAAYKRPDLQDRSHQRKPHAQVHVLNVTMMDILGGRGS